MDTKNKPAPAQAREEEALAEIASQKLPEEMDEEGDYEAGYRGCVERARATLCSRPSATAADDDDEDPSTWGPREVIGDLLNHWSAGNKMTDFPRCVSRARELFADLAARPSAQGEDEALEAVRAYIEGCPRKSITDKQARASALKALATLSAVVATAKTETAAIKYAIVQTAGGTIEGRPTNELNYLQRLRELVDTEARLAASAKDDAKMREALAVAGGYVREALDEWDSKYQRHPATEAKRKIIENDLAAVDAALKRKETE